MSRTPEAQKHQRYKRALRWILVNTAGNVDPNCPSRDVVEIVDTVTQAREHGVRIPRSYRNKILVYRYKQDVHPGDKE